MRGHRCHIHQSQAYVWKGCYHLPLTSETCSHAQIGAQILVCDVQQEVSIHLELLHSMSEISGIPCNKKTFMSVFGSYLETVTEGAKANLLQPGLHFTGFPVGHTWHDTFWCLLPHHSQCPFS